MTEKDRIYIAGDCASDRKVEILAPAGSCLLYTSTGSHYLCFKLDRNGSVYYGSAHYVKYAHIHAEKDHP